MKKLLVILSILFSLSVSGQVKISAMPFWSGSMDSAYVPIVVNLVNYKTLTSRINQTRIDSIVNNWPAGGSARFGFSGEDDLSNETRSFDANGNDFGITNLNSGITAYVLYRDAITGIITWGAAPAAQRFGVSGEDDVAAENRLFDVTGFTFGISGLPTATTSNVIYYNTSTGAFTYGASPSGSGSGIQSIEGNNGVTVLTDSIVQWGSSTNSGVPFTGNRWLNTSTFVATIRGSSSLWPLQVENTGNAYAARFATNAGPAIQVSNVPANVASIATIADFIRAGSGSSSAGVGGALDTYVWIDNTNGSTYAGSTFFTLTNTTYATRSSDFGIKVVNSAATSTAVLVKASGNMELQNAGKGYALRSPNNTVYYIVVDNSGNLSTTTTAP